jgi:hypothetical protein
MLQLFDRFWSLGDDVAICKFRLPDTQVRCCCDNYRPGQLARQLKHTRGLASRADERDARRRIHAQSLRKSQRHASII